MPQQAAQIPQQEAQNWMQSWWNLGFEVKGVHPYTLPKPPRKDHGLHRVDPSPYRQSWHSLGLEFQKAPLTIHEKRAEGGIREAQMPQQAAQPAHIPPPYPPAQQLGQFTMWGGPVMILPVY